MAMTILISDVDGYPVYVVIKKKKKMNPHNCKFETCDTVLK